MGPSVTCHALIIVLFMLSLINLEDALIEPHKYRVANAISKLTKPTPGFQQETL